MIALDKLTDKLQQQGELYKEFLALAEAKKKVLINGDIPALEQIIAKEQVLFTNARNLEEERMVILDGLAQTHGLNATELTMAKLIQLASPADKEKLEKVMEEIQNLIKEIKEINCWNSSLIKQSLEFIDFSVNLLTNINESNYGTKDNKQPALLIDRKI